MVRNLIFGYLFDHINNLWHVIRDPWFHGRWEAMKRFHVLIEFFTESPTQTDRILTQLVRSSNYLQNSKIADSAMLILPHQCRKRNWYLASNPFPQPTYFSNLTQLRNQRKHIFDTPF